MKRALIMLSVAVLCVSSLVLAETVATQPATKPAATQPDVFKTQMDKVSYAMGLGLGTNAKKQDVDVNIDMFVKGFKDAMADKPLLTEQQIQETMMAFMQDMQTKAREKQNKQAEANKKEGEEFLAKNAKEEGVVTLPSGLQYKVVKEGDGPSPKATDTVEVRYRGTLISGTEFDTSGDSAREFGVSNVVPGFSEALQKMKVGSKWKVFIPSELGYGPQQRGQQIGPNSTLIFDLELVSIKPPSTQPAAPKAPAFQMPRPGAATQPAAR